MKAGEADLPSDQADDGNAVPFGEKELSAHRSTLSITRRVARRGREAIQSAEAWREAEADGRLVELVGLYINREEDVV